MTRTAENQTENVVEIRFQVHMVDVDMDVVDMDDVDMLDENVENHKNVDCKPSSLKSPHRTTQT